MLLLTFKANSSYEKSVHLNMFLAYCQMVKTFFWVCRPENHEFETVCSLCDLDGYNRKLNHSLAGN